ncbi:MAG: DUF4129 domain-containing protein [Clostridia bacterium]|nr:DUF4129 domain-containing protein [Clostridia bacterium]
MKERLSILPMKALAALGLVLGIAPICLVAGRHFLPMEPVRWVLPLLFAWTWGILIFLMPGRGRVPFAVAGVFALALLGGIMYRAAGLGMLLILGPCAAALFLMPPAYPRLYWEEWPPGLWVAGVLAHLICQFIASQPSYAGVDVYLKCAFVPYIFLLLICFNRTGLRSGMHGAAKAPAALRARNGILTAGLFLIALAASLWGRLAQWADAAWRAILRLILTIVDAIMSLFPESSGGAGDGGGSMSFGELAQEGETSPLAAFLEKVLMVMTAVIAVLLAVFVIRFLGKRLIQLVKRIKERLRAYSALSAEDYVDEAESTLNWEEKTKSLREKIGKSLARTPRPTPWEQLDGRQRVRRLYQQYLKKRPEMKGKTAREALAQDGAIDQKQAAVFSGLYEKARYSDHDISAAAADELRRSVRDAVSL